MKEQDLEKNLDNLIIDGLIKEAEQDDADFEAAMLNMSDEEFAELLYEYVPVYEGAGNNSRTPLSVAADTICFANRDPEIYEPNEIDTEDSQPVQYSRSKRTLFRPWILSAVVAAIVILFVLIPSINTMNGKLCDSALYASTAYITSSRGANEVNRLTTNQLKAKLPELEKRYDDCIKADRKLIFYTDDLQEAGWALTVAYLKLHKKGDAVEVLKFLSKRYNGTPFGDHCQNLIRQL